MMKPRLMLRFAEQGQRVACGVRTLRNQWPGADDKSKEQKEKYAKTSHGNAIPPSSFPRKWESTSLRIWSHGFPLSREGRGKITSSLPTGWVRAARCRAI